MSAQKRNDRADRIGWTLQHQTAQLITLTLDHINTELAFMSAYAEAGYSLGISGGGPSVQVDEDEHGPAERIPVTSVEAAIIRADGLREIREQLRDRLDGIEIAVNDLNRLLRRTLGARVPRTIPELCDGRARGYEGHRLAWVPYSRDPLGGWHDPSCRDAAGPSGCCPKCLLRLNRWREERGLSWITEGKEPHDAAA